MEKNIKILGKVRPTVEGTHDINKEYSLLSIVKYENSTYISKKDVPKNINISNEDYWQLICVGSSGYDIDVNNEDLISNIHDNKKIIQFNNRNNSKGKGYIILRTDKPLTEQMMQENTIYEVRYDFDLNDKTLEIPSDCVLDFKGGSFKNGTLVGNNASLLSYPTYNIFNDTILKDFNFGFLDVRWFGAVSDFVSKESRGSDSSFAFQRALDNAVMYHIGIPIVVLGNYYMATPVETNLDLNLRGTHSPARRLIDWGSDNTPNAVFKSPSSIFVAEGITAFTLNGMGNVEVGNPKATHLTIDSLKLESVDTTSAFVRCTTFGAPSRPGFCRNTEASGFKNVFVFDFVEGANQYGTNYYNFTIGDSCNFFDNINSIYAKGRNNTSPSLGGLSIVNSTLEHGAKIQCSNLFGYNEIRNNLMEGQKDTLTISLNYGHIEIVGNYFEANTGSLTFSTGHPNSSWILHDNFVSNCDSLGLYFWGGILKQFDSSFNAKNVTLHDVKIEDTSLIKRLTPAAVETVYPIWFPQFRHIKNENKPSVDFTQIFPNGYSSIGTFKIKETSETIQAQQFSYNNTYLWTWGYIDTPITKGQYVVISFYKCKGGRLNWRMFDQDGNPEGLMNINDLCPYNGYYTFGFTAPRDMTKLGIRPEPSLEQDSIVLSKPTISIFASKEDSKKYSLADVAVINTDMYNSPKYGSVPPNPEHYFNDFNKTIGKTFFNTETQKQMIFNGTSWINVDGTPTADETEQSDE